MNAEITQNLELETTENTPVSKVATLFRWVGIGAFALSTIVFLLQGIDAVDSILRNWTYLILMVVVGALGVGVQRLLQDAKSARLLLGAGVALIPIQFAQLAGLLHDLFGTSTTAWLASALPMDSITLLIGAACSAVLAIPVAMAGFRVLARTQTKHLTVYLLAAAAMLLLPFREGIAAWVTVAGLLGITLFADRKFIAAGAVARTLEGRAVRFLLAIPATIAVVRLGFYIETLAAFAALLAIAAAIMVICSRIYLKQSSLGEAVLFAGAMSGALAWAMMMYVVDPAFIVQATLIPAAIMIMVLGAISRAPHLYRSIGCAGLLIATYPLLMSGVFADQSLALVIGLLLSVQGYLAKWREPVMLGAILTLGAFGAMLIQTLGNVELVSWLSLAIGGITLVIVASVLERHGRNLRVRLNATWDTLKSW